MWGRAVRTTRPECAQPRPAGPRGAPVVLGGERSRVAVPPVATSGRGARSLFLLVSTYRIGDLSRIEFSCICWSAAPANSHQENWAHSPISALLRRRATTVGCRHRQVNRALCHHIWRP